jgi:hypothetical protein
LTDTSKQNEGSLLIYGNLLISSEERLGQLKITAPQWLKYWGSKALIRLRGEYAESAAVFLSGFPKVRVEVGQCAKTWRMQSYDDLRGATQEYIFNLYEDHILSSNAPSSSAVLADVIKHQCDVYQYSWFFTHAPLRLWQEKEKNVTVTSTSLISTFDLPLARVCYQDIHLYLVSMSSIFRKDFHLARLKSPRPLLRKYDPTGPFDLEAVCPDRRLMPLVFGQSIHEIGICIDDDHLVPQSSAISRGLVAPELIAKMQHQHHTKRTFFYYGKLMLKSNNSPRSKHLERLKSVTLALALRIDWLIFSVSSLLFFLSDLWRIRTKTPYRHN